MKNRPWLTSMAVSVAGLIATPLAHAGRLDVETGNGAVAVPEPETLLLFVLGVGAIAFVRKMRT